MTDNIGMPISGINMTYNNTGVIGPQDGDIQIKLKEGHKPTEEHVRVLREQLPRLFPGMSFSFLPADIVSQILNFGAPAPIDLQIRGANLEGNFAYANKLLSRIRRIPGRGGCTHPAIADMRRPSTSTSIAPARNMSASPSATSPTASWSISRHHRRSRRPIWLNPENGVSYPIVMQTPQYQIDTLAHCRPCRSPRTGNTQSPILGGIADIKRATSSAVVSHYDIQPLVQIYRHHAGARSWLGCQRHPRADGRDRQGPAEGYDRGAAAARWRPCTARFPGLLFGLLAAIVLIYLLIVVNFQSWSDPFVIVTALPGRARRHRLDAVCDAHHALACRR